MYCSLIPGIILLVLMALVAAYSQYVIVSTCRIVDKYTYKEMGIVGFFVLIYHRLHWERLEALRSR